MSQPQNTTNAQAIADRQFAVQEKVRELQRANPEMSYDTAFAECKKLPEMLRTFNAMQKPDAIPDPFQVQERSSAQRKAAAQFNGKAQAAAHQRGITFDQAWAAMREEEPELWEAMGGNHDLVKEGYDRISRPA